MDNSRSGTLSDAEADRMLNEILEEDREENLDDDDEDDDEGDESECTAACAEDPAVKKRFCECVRMAENSSRFSLRVMEAMRLLQRKEDRLLPTSTAEDIVDYIQATYHDDGDLYAQVRTTLKQIRYGIVRKRVSFNRTKSDLDEPSHLYERSKRLRIVFAS
ncbi:uncharacterized protein [Bombus fervidus]|uniref:uncharacterized protein n=1 Tax=Bombus fervidus TaxID=203811 RepID=UPI003AB8FED3